MVTTPYRKGKLFAKKCLNSVAKPMPRRQICCKNVLRFYSYKFSIYVDTRFAYSLRSPFGESDEVSCSVAQSIPWTRLSSASYWQRQNAPAIYFTQYHCSSFRLYLSSRWWNWTKFWILHTLLPINIEKTRLGKNTFASISLWNQKNAHKNHELQKSHKKNCTRTRKNINILKSLFIRSARFFRLSFVRRWFFVVSVGERNM